MSGGKAGIDAKGTSVARPALTVRATAGPATTGERTTIAAPTRTAARALS